MNPTQAIATIDHARKFLQSKGVQDTIAQGLQKHMSVERMTRLVLTACQKSPKLLECFGTEAGKRSVGLAMLTASQLGLEPDGRQCHLVPFRDKRANATLAVCIPGYQGLIGLAYNHPKVRAIWSDVVYENDHFVYRKGLSVILEHAPTLKGEPGELLAAYAVCELEGGSKVTVVLTARDIERIKSFSRGAQDDSSPWNTHASEMWKKSALRALAKIVPQSPQLQRALEHEDAFEAGRTIDVQVSAEPEVRFNKEVKAAPAMLPTAADSAPPTEAVPEVALQGTEETMAGEQATASAAAAPNEPNPAPSPSGEAEAPLYQRVEEFYGRDNYDKVLGVLAKMNCPWAVTTQAKTFNGLTEAQLRTLWTGRKTIHAELNRKA